MTIIKLLSLILSILFLFGCSAKNLPTNVSEEKMQAIYEQIKTPYKYGIVIRPPQKKMLVDSPSVFRNGDKWYMYYVLQDGTGYSTHIAESSDLLNWQYKGEILKRKNNNDWDITLQGSCGIHVFTEFHQLPQKEKGYKTPYQK